MTYDTQFDKLWCEGMRVTCTRATEMIWFPMDLLNRNTFLIVNYCATTAATAATWQWHWNRERNEIIIIIKKYVFFCRCLFVFSFLSSHFVLIVWLVVAVPPPPPPPIVCVCCAAHQPRALQYEFICSLLCAHIFRSAVLFVFDGIDFRLTFGNNVCPLSFLLRHKWWRNWHVTVSISIDCATRIHTDASPLMGIVVIGTSADHRFQLGTQWFSVVRKISVSTITRFFSIFDWFIEMVESFNAMRQSNLNLVLYNYI